MPERDRFTFRTGNLASRGFGVIAHQTARASRPAQFANMGKGSWEKRLEKGAEKGTDLLLEKTW